MGFYFSPKVYFINFLVYEFVRREKIIGKQWRRVKVVDCSYSNNKHHQSFACYRRIFLLVFRHWFYWKYFYWRNHEWLLFVRKCIDVSDFCFISNSADNIIMDGFTDKKHVKQKRTTCITPSVFPSMYMAYHQQKYRL